MPLPTLAEQHRFHLLDAIRGAAAVLVVVYHVPVHPMLFPESWLAVDLFFCLSGFVVCASYEERLRTKMSMKTFVLTRMVRLYPLQILGMAIMVLALYFQHVHHPQAASDLSWLTAVFGFLLLPVFTSSTFALTFPLNRPAWSLFFEMIANLIYALLVRLRIATTELLLTICVVSFGLLVIASRATSVGFNVGWGTHTFLPGFARVSYSFFTGVLLFRLYRSNIRFRITTTLSNITSIFVLLLVVVCLTHSVRPGMQWAYDGSMIGLVFPALVFVGAFCKPGGGWVRVCSFCGDVSYPLYILHLPIMVALSFILVHLGAGVRPEAVAFGMIGILVPVCWWIGKYLDAPTRRHLAAKLRGNVGPQPAGNVVHSQTRHTEH